MTNPSCARTGCGHSQGVHDPAAGLHPCEAPGCSCASWRLPDCPGCSRPVELHELLDPHASSVVDGIPVCEGYVFGQGTDAESYQGGGGGFGGGGASGGW